MIPDFDENGNLPIGIHKAPFNEVIQRFGGAKSLKRSSLTKSLKEFYSFIRLYAVEIYIDGSYVTSKLSPSDVDLLVVFPLTFFSERQLVGRLADFMRRSPRKLHIFAFKEGIQEKKIKELLDWFTEIETTIPKE